MWQNLVHIWWDHFGNHYISVVLDGDDSFVGGAVGVLGVVAEKGQAKVLISVVFDIIWVFVVFGG